MNIPTLFLSPTPAPRWDTPNLPKFQAIKRITDLGLDINRLMYMRYLAQTGKVNEGE